jgi:hypothetical protein
MAPRVLSLLLVGLMAPHTLAQSETEAPKRPESLLAGPRVETSTRATLVERESDGAIRRTETPPELAAVRLLELPKEVAERIEKLTHERGRFLEKFVENNLDLLSKLDTAGKTNDKLDQALLGIEAISKLAPLTRDGSLNKRVRALLPEAALERFDAILDEYWDAIVAQERTKDPKKSRFEIVAGERVQSVTREIAAAVQRLEKSGTLLFSYFFSKVELSKEQETEIRALLDEFVEETKGSPTKEQEQKIFFGVMSKLDTKQQTELIRQFQGRAPKQPDKPAKKNVDE